MTGDIADIRSRLPIAKAWRALNLTGEPARSGASPFRPDKNPSFSVYHEATGDRWKDHATGDGGDVLDLIEKARGCTTAEALTWARSILGIDQQADRRPDGKRRWSPDLRLGTPEQLQKLSTLRGYSMEGLQEASQRGFLFFAEMAKAEAWAVTDRRRQVIELRRLDGKKWSAYGALPERKAHCIGHGKQWPIGVEEAADYNVVALAEGAPDFLALFTFFSAEERSDVAACGVLGAASHRLAPEALAKLKAKQVCIYGHNDEAGAAATKAWARALRDAGAKVTAFDLGGIVRADGRAGKDLNDVLLMDADTYERERKFWRVLP
jgi:hypothetical protein